MDRVLFPRAIGVCRGGAVRDACRYVCLTEELAANLDVSRVSYRLVDLERAWVWIDRRLYARKVRRVDRLND